MALVINTQKEFKYIPYSERGGDNPFTVTFKILGVAQLAKLDDGLISVVENEGMSIRRGTYSYRAVKTALVSWENIGDGEKDIPLIKSGKGEVEDTSLAYIPSSILDEIANVIIACSKNPSLADVYLGNIKDEEAPQDIEDIEGTEEVVEEAKKPKASSKHS